MSTAIVTPAFGTPEYLADLDASQGINQPTAKVRARGVLPAPVFGLLALVALLTGLFGAAALSGGITFVSAPTPVEVEVVPAVDEVEKERGGSILVEVPER